MKRIKIDKTKRALDIYDKLLGGSCVKKSEEAAVYGVTERSIQRDIDIIRSYLEESCPKGDHINSVVYSRAEKGYRLEHLYSVKFTNSEILAFCKILLSSRAFTKKEMQKLLNKLIACCIPTDNQKLVANLVKNNLFHYVELRHKTKFIDMMWQIGTAIDEHRYIEIAYKRTKDMSVVKRRLKPVAIMFSEFYFYLTAFIDDEKIKEDFEVLNDSFPTIYRIDRIKKLTVSNDNFHIPYKNRFEEGDFLNKIQFMYGGKLQKVKFKYFGTDIDAILDRLPTAKILAQGSDEYTIEAEVFGRGIDMWLRSQGGMVKILS